MKASDDKQSMSEALLTVKDVMGLLNISQSSVYRLIDNRNVTFFKIKSGLRFRRSDIDSYLTSCRFDAFS
jgi:excisionase family DNA binding protein